MISSVWRLLLEHIPADEGATAVEYAIMAAAIAAVIVVAVVALGLRTVGLFQGTEVALGKLVGL